MHWRWFGREDLEPLIEMNQRLGSAIGRGNRKTV
jgi:hypothetical protein